MNGVIVLSDLRGHEKLSNEDEGAVCLVTSRLIACSAATQRVWSKYLTFYWINRVVPVLFIYAYMHWNGTSMLPLQYNYPGSDDVRQSQKLLENECARLETNLRLAPVYALHDWKVQERNPTCFNLIKVTHVGRCRTSRANKDGSKDEYRLIWSPRKSTSREGWG